jgi:type VI secretion system protein ImpM
MNGNEQTNTPSEPAPNGPGTGNGTGIATGTGTGTGFYGKLPSLGDFVSRRLPAQLVQPWDQWLRGCLGASQSQLGGEWLDAYLTSPLWRFVLTPGIAGQTGWAGVLMPSVDRVGRYFPLTLATPLPGISDPFRVLCDSGWFERAESLALSGLADGFDIEAFDAQAQALAPPELPVTQVAAAQSAPAPGRADAWHIDAASPADLAGAYPKLLARALDEVFFAYSLWCSAGSERVAPSFLTCQGLPPPELYAALLVGDWAARGWRTIG